MAPDDAARAARVRLGGITQLKEAQREGRGLASVGGLSQDAWYAVRVYRRTQGFTLIAVLTIAVGIGVNATMFALLNAVAFKRLPVADARDLFRVERSFQSGGAGGRPVRLLLRRVLLLSVTQPSACGAHRCELAGTLVFAGGDGVPLQAQFVSGNYFTALGVSPTLGRSFLPEDDRIPGKVPVVVLSDTFWRRYLHGDAGVVGRTISLNGTAFTIIGVAPATFIGTGNPPQVPDFWVPLMMQGTVNPAGSWLGRRDLHRLQLLTRATSATLAEETRAELQLLQSQLTEEVETHREGDRTIALALQPAGYFGGTDDVRFAALVGLIMAIVLLVLVVACANLANMLLARGVARHREIALRLALGASRGRIVRQLLTESLLLAALGGVSGLLLSLWGSLLTFNFYFILASASHLR